MAAIFWFRRDLRLDDNAGFYHALKENREVIPVFIFDKQILDKLDEKTDARVHFIHNEICRLQKELALLGSSIKVYHGDPLEIIRDITQRYSIHAVYANHDYEPNAIKRDLSVRQLLESRNIAFKTFKDQCIFEKNEIVKDDQKPYTVFTPYSRKWKATLTPFHTMAYPTEKYFSSLIKDTDSNIPTLQEIGFDKSNIEIPERNLPESVVKNYHNTRNFPSIAGTSRLSVHLRFGTISVKKLTEYALKHNETYLNELIWRDFYMMILWHFPHVTESAFKPAYNHIQWRNNEAEFEHWCKGETGYPLVDAGMRELNATGFMHNRVRMVVASFLCKHLLIDWKWGEAYFAKKLLDFDLSANNGGWQWAAGSGCDAAPYFRIFNPQSQLEKFDKNLGYVRKWVPEFDNPFTYSKPIVEHTFARERCLNTYKTALNSVN
jgi:deoxyribodipyrimidine photo-lyase